MRTWLAKYRPGPELTRKLLMLAALVGVGVAAFYWGRWQSASANPPDQTFHPNAIPATPGGSTQGYDRRVVAYVYGNVPVLREELGEYLIARFGAERLDFMINRKIVEAEYAAAKLRPITDADVETRFQRDLRSFGVPMTEKEFVNSILKRFNKTLYEWKEDVIRPKLMMEELVRPKVARSLSEKDFRDGFEARHGPKVQCRMIVLDRKNPKHLEEVWQQARKGRDAFLEQARKQFIPNLAALEGKVPPIHKHFGDVELEDAAFRLKENEISSLITLKDGTIVMLYCEKHLPADASRRLEDERTKLREEMQELRIAQTIPEEFKLMRERAAPKLMLKGATEYMVQPIAPPPPLNSKENVIVPPVSEAPPQPVVVPPAPVPGPVGTNLSLPAPPMPSVVPNVGPAKTSGQPRPVSDGLVPKDAFK